MSIDTVKTPKILPDDSMALQAIGLELPNGPVQPEAMPQLTDQSAQLGETSLPSVVTVGYVPELQDRYELGPTKSYIEEVLSPGGMEKKIGKSLAEIDFESTPEVEESLRDYFGTHYQLAAMVGTALSEDPKIISEEKKADQISHLSELLETSVKDEAGFDRDFEALISYGNAPTSVARIMMPFLSKIRLERLKRPDDQQLERAEQQLMAGAVNALFAEASLGVTAIDDQDRNTADALYDSVMKMLEGSPYFNSRGDVLNIPGGVRRSIPRLVSGGHSEVIKQAENLFWLDSRYAGQLLFHNSGDMPETRSQGAIMPRRMQLAHKGKVFNQTAETLDDHIHSPTVHWSEYFTSEYKGGKRGGTIAMPLKKIVSVAPYARDAQYGTLRVKPDRIESVREKITLRGGHAKINFGSPDFQGITGTDRTFYSSPHDVEPDAPIETAPDGHAFKQGREDFAVVLGPEESAIAQQSGLGENFPQIFEIDAPPKPDGQSAEVWWDTIASSIKGLQETSIGRWPSEFVVPVRAGGVLDFYVPDDRHYPMRQRAKFTKTT